MGGLKVAKLSQYPCPRIQSFLVLNFGLMMSVLKGKSISPRDERGCVTEEVVKKLVIANDSILCYVVGPYLRISEYLNKSVVNTVKRAW